MRWRETVLDWEKGKKRKKRRRKEAELNRQYKIKW